MSDIKLRHRKDGTPYVQLRFGRDAQNRPRRLSKSFPGMSDAEAMEAASAWREKLQRGTLGDALARYNQTKSSTNTLKTYERYARLYSEPIAMMAVDEVDVPSLNRLFQSLLKEGVRRGKPLSAYTVSQYRYYLQGAFNYFVSEKMIMTNPVKETIKIQHWPDEGHALDDVSLRKLVDWIDATLSEEPETDTGILRRNAAFAMWLALHTGVRAGEACAIRQQDVVLRLETLKVNGSVVVEDGAAVRQNHTKSGKSRNLTLAFDEMRVVREHVAWQRGRLGDYGSDTPLVTVDGTLMKPKTLSDQFRRTRDLLGIGREYHFHSLRHTNATLLLQTGVDPKTVQERLGHARASTTLDIYGHAMRGRDAGAAASIDRTLKEI